MPNNWETQSTEQAYHHDICADHGAFACHTCELLTASLEIDTAQSCTRLGEGAAFPGRLSLEVKEF